MEKLKALIEVKKIIALILTIVFCVLSLKGLVTAEQFITIFSVIIAFYFGQSSARAAAKEANK
jgi:hypothetical protein